MSSRSLPTFSSPLRLRFRWCRTCVAVLLARRRGRALPRALCKSVPRCSVIENSCGRAHRAARLCSRFFRTGSSDSRVPIVAEQPSNQLYPLRRWLLSLWAFRQSSSVSFFWGTTSSAVIHRRLAASTTRKHALIRRPRSPPPVSHKAVRCRRPGSPRLGRKKVIRLPK